MPAHGFTPDYIRVEIDAAKVKENDIVTVRLGGFNDAGDALIGTLI